MIHINLADHINATLNRQPASRPAAPVFDVGDYVKAKLGKQRKVGTVELAGTETIWIHPDGLGRNSIEPVHLSDGWRVEHITEVP